MDIARTAARKKRMIFSLRIRKLLLNDTNGLVLSLLSCFLFVFERTKTRVPQNGYSVLCLFCFTKNAHTPKRTGAGFQLPGFYFKPEVVEMPLINCFCARKKMMMSGRVNITPAAISRSHS